MQVVWEATPSVMAMMQQALPMLTKYIVGGPSRGSSAGELAVYYYR